MNKFSPPIKNLHAYLKSLADTQGEKIALASYTKSGALIEKISYCRLFELIEKTGEWMTCKGLKAGDRIAIQFTNSIELLVLSWTAWAIGVVSVPLDTKRDTEDDIKYKTELSKTKMVLSPENFNFEIATRAERAEAVASAGKEISVSWCKDLNHEALILFTSGTTGRPKGASLSLQNLIANGDGIREWFNITSADTFMVILPLHHINSTSFCFASLLGGATIAIPPAYSASQFFAQAAGSGATFTSVVPTICYDQISQVGEFAKYHDEIKLNRIQIGSAPVKPSDVRRFMDLFGVKIKLFQGYGQTETALRVTGLPLDLPQELYKKLTEENSIGVPMKWATVAVLDNDGNQVKEETEGELAVKGPIVMKGYIGGEKAFNNDGWFMTGDLGYFKEIDDRKFYYIKGRLKEIIIKGGVNISPAAVEEKVKQIDSNIDKICVIGVPDIRYGEEVAAGICWKENTGLTVQQMETRLKNRLSFDRKEIAVYEIPEYIFTMTEEEIPMTSTRKVQRSVLAKQIDPNRLQPILQVAKNDQYEFTLLRSNNKPLMKQAFELFNKCWEPLGIDLKTFTAHTDNGVTILAVKDGKVDGFVSVLITDISEEALGNLTYEKATGDLTMNTFKENGDKAVCMAIGSSNYVPKEVSNKTRKIQTPTEAEVEKYLETGLDHVYKFHTRSKAGLPTGATLVKLMKNSRPEDKDSMGYNMLMKYPRLPRMKIIPDATASVGVQLIEAAMLYAQNLGIEEVYAFSRPAGLREYWMSLDKR